MKYDDLILFVRGVQLKYNRMFQYNLIIPEHVRHILWSGVEQEEQKSTIKK